MTEALLQFLVGVLASCVAFDLGWSFFVKMSR